MNTRKILTAVAICFGSLVICQAQFVGKPQYQILTTRAGTFLGNINIELYPAVAPNHVKNFDSLVSQVFFDTTAFHRVIPGFMIQGGDPNSRHGPKSTWGYGDPSQPTVNAEFSVLKHLRGILSAARDANINSANSQFFICVASASWLDGQYSIYGHVLTGMNIVDTIVAEPRDANDCPFQKIEMFVTYTGTDSAVTPDPVLDVPASGTQNAGINKLCKWFASTGDIMYQMEVSTDSMFSTLFLNKKVTTAYNTVTGLQGSTTYYWRIKATNGGNWSGYSPTWHFSTTMNSGVHDLAFEKSGYKLEQNTPNPANGQTVIKYTVPGKERISITLFDAEGRVAAVWVDEEKNKGDHLVVVDLTKYSAGTYFYRMEAGTLSDTRKLVVEK